jgi:aldehyde dehydrogenase (NAD+)
MGGKNPLIVCEDADIDFAVQLAVAGSMQLAGQKCTATSRVIVDEKVCGIFTDKLLTTVQGLRTGDPLQDTTDVGPVVDEDALASILEYIESGKRDGAVLAAGGNRLTDNHLAKGAYCAPTVFTDVRPGMAIAEEEIFGPVLAVFSSKGHEQAITLANDTIYGLSASICTQDLGRAQKFIEEIDVGLVHVNSTTSGAEVHVPFGGMKDSSSGFREMGPSGIDFYTNVKTVYYSW